jgi:hypothetical protein
MADKKDSSHLKAVLECFRALTGPHPKDSSYFEVCIYVYEQISLVHRHRRGFPPIPPLSLCVLRTTKR